MEKSLQAYGIFWGISDALAMKCLRSVDKISSKRLLPIDQLILPLYKFSGVFFQEAVIKDQSIFPTSCMTSPEPNKFTTKQCV